MEERKQRLVARMQAQLLAQSGGVDEGRPSDGDKRELQARVRRLHGAGGEFAHVRVSHFVEMGSSTQVLRPKGDRLVTMEV